MRLAERTGFEPADHLRGHGFSKPALSTTQPPLLREKLLCLSCFLRFYRELLLGVWAVDTR